MSKWYTESRREAAKRYYKNHKKVIDAKNIERNRTWKKRDPIAYMLIHIKCRAKKIGVPFNLEREDIIIPARCPVFNYKLKFTAGKTTNQTPSLDRIVPERGYVKGNVRVLSMRANTLKNNATINELQKVLAYVDCDSSTGA